MSNASHATFVLLLFGFALITKGAAHGAVAHTSSNWKNYISSGGMQLQIPSEWMAHSEKDGKVVVSGPGGEKATIWPVFTRNVLDGQATDAIARNLAINIWPSASFTALPGAKHTVRLEGRDTQATGMAILSCARSNQGMACTMHLASAPAARYRQAQPVFAHIFQSARIQGSHGSADDGSDGRARDLQYTQWRDPREGAFTVELPLQWHAQGGTARYAAVDVRPSVQAQSPDQKVLIFSGDPSLPPFTLPNPMLAMAGMREGSWYDAGYGVRMMVRRYMTGANFAYQYATETAGKTCSGMKVSSPSDRSDIASGLNAVYRQFMSMGMMVQLSVGEVTFTCSYNGSPVDGYLMAGTLLTQSQNGSGIWAVQYLYGYMASTDREDEARMALNHLVATFRIDPQWEAQQQQATMRTSQIVAQTQQQISEGIMKSWASRNRTYDEISRRRENAILGTVDVVSPSGERYKIDNSSNYYWIDGNGNIAGTQTYTRPDIDFQEMTQLP